MARRDWDFSFSIDGEQKQTQRSSARSGRGRWKRPSERPPGKVVRDLLLGAVLSLAVRWIFSSGSSVPEAPLKKPTLVEVDLVQAGMPVLSSFHGPTARSSPALVMFHVPGHLCEQADRRCVADLFRDLAWATSVDDLDGVEPGLSIEMELGTSVHCLGKAQRQPEDVAWPSMYGIADNRETTGGAVWQFSYSCSK